MLATRTVAGLGKRMRLLPTLILILSIAAARADVRLVEKGGRFQLHRNGQPYLVKGGGGNEKSLASLAASGGNSIRLWGDDHLGETLDAAQKLGLTVTAGIWLGQVRQGFDWSDAASLAKQREHIRQTVLKHKDHPALLCWALGNEMEDPEGKNGAVWTAINSLSVMVHQLDPAHPTMTVVAEIGGEKVQNIHKLCPEIDIVGINSYAGAVSVAERYRKNGGTKPYLLTEYGPEGIWEIAKNAVGAYPEQTSTEKAAVYKAVYAKAVLGEPALCLGSYAFLWGQKQEVTSTWFSMALADGTRLGAMDVMQEYWTGKAPANRCPELKSLKLDGAEKIVEPGTTLQATLAASDPEGDALKVEWLLQRDPGEYGSGGDKESAPPTFPEAITKATAAAAEIKAPAEGGLYRLFATVRDSKGGGAVANIPLRVRGDAKVAPAKKATLPLTVYAEAEAAQTFIPAGWMGDAKAIHLDPASTDQPHSGKTAMRCEFASEKGWGGVVWQSPAGDWGDQSGGYDLSGAKKITFWARGESGGEKLAFKFGIIKDKKFSDTATGALENVTLTKEWQRFEVPASGDLTRIKTGFVWTLAAAGKPIVFHLDDVRWE